MNTRTKMIRRAAKTCGRSPAMCVFNSRMNKITGKKIERFAESYNINHVKLGVYQFGKPMD